jgi:hypothetical protein
MLDVGKELQHPASSSLKIAGYARWRAYPGFSDESFMLLDDVLKR